MLNERGWQGWELVAVVTAGLDYVAFLKRPAESESKT